MMMSFHGLRFRLACTEFCWRSVAEKNTMPQAQAQSNTVREEKLRFDTVRHEKTLTLRRTTKIAQEHSPSLVTLTFPLSIIRDTD
jgi:hypothetical protein